MYLEEVYNYYRLAFDLGIEKRFNIIHMDSVREEIWLEQKIGKNAHVIRFAHRSYDWANQLKNDVAISAEKAKSLKRTLNGKKLIFHSVYIAKYPPVDEWEKLKHLRPEKGSKQAEVNLYYLSEEDFSDEMNRLYANLGKQAPELEFPGPDTGMEEETIRLRERVRETYRRRREQMESLFSYGKPFFIYVILVINLLMFYLLEVNGGSTSPSTLIKFGAKYNPAILEGEWWRIVSSMFLHVGFLHLFMNMLALYYLGTAVERIFGSARFLPVYFLAGIFGGMTSFVFNNQVAAGASGALFGLFGALLFFGLVHREIFFQTMGWNLLFIIALNISIGIMIPQIDNGAHMGGLIGGFIASGAVSLPKNKNIVRQILFSFLYVIGIACLWFAGTAYSSESYNAEVQIQLAQQHVSEENYKKAYEDANRGIGSSESYQAELLFYRAYAAIHLEKTDQAIMDLEQVVKMDAELPEAHYNLALLYTEKDRITDALKQAEKAYRLRPENEQFQRLYERLSDQSQSS